MIPKMMSRVTTLTGNLTRPGMVPYVPDEQPELTQPHLDPVQESGCGKDFARDQGEPDDGGSPAGTGKQAAHGAHGHDQDAGGRLKVLRIPTWPVTVLLAVVAFLDRLLAAYSAGSLPDLRATRSRHGRPRSCKRRDPAGSSSTSTSAIRLECAGLS